MTPQSADTKDKKASRVLDEYLVLAAVAGDRKAFENLARRWNRRMIAHAWRLTGDSEAASDVAQTAWVEIARSLPRLRDETAFPAWAYRIVSRQCARLIHDRQHDRALTRGIAAQPEIEPSDPTEHGSEAPLHAAIRGLPATQRAAVALYYFEEMSIAETAVALDVPAGTIKTRLMHARRTLRSALQGDTNA